MSTSAAEQYLKKALTEIPPEVGDRLEILDTYKENPKLEQAITFHVYPGDVCYPDGYYSNRFFRLVAYSHELYQYRDLGEYDRIDFFNDASNIKVAGVYLDGSFFFVMREEISLKRASNFGGNCYLGDM